LQSISIRGYDYDVNGLLTQEATAMARRRSLTDKMIAKLERGRRYMLSDPEQRNLFLRIPPDSKAPITFAVYARDPYGKVRYGKVGTTADLTIEQRARQALLNIKDGKDAVEKPKPLPESVADVSANWLEQHVRKNRLRSAPEYERILQRYVLPPWRDRKFIELKRSDIRRLLDAVEGNSGPGQARNVLSVIRSMASWQQDRDDDYVPPTMRGMRRATASRERILTDNELRTIWRASGDGSQFGAFVRLLLLTAQRKAKVATMKWSDLADDTWTISKALREKTNAGQLQLPALALEVLAGLPRVAGNDYVFAGRGAKPFDGGKHKAQFDAHCDVIGWTLHDLRRTARSLMSRAGVSREVAERVLGHTIGSTVEQTYDRHRYDVEKAVALRKLADLIARIVEAPNGNVVELRGATP
jgi:integrase